MILHFNQINHFVTHFHTGDLMKEEEVLAWILKNKEEDMIEEVTDEILENMLKQYEYVLVFFGMT